MLSYFRVFLCKVDDLVTVEVVEQSRVDFPWELIEVVEEFDVDEHGRGMGELVRDNVQKCFGTKQVAFGASFAPLRFEGRNAELEHTQPVGV